VKTLHFNGKSYSFIVLTLSLIISLGLASATYYINYWPSDSHNPYIPTAARLFDVPYLSYMHKIPIQGMLRVTMHFKETLILGIAIMQRILHDFQTLYPNVLLLILAQGLSTVLVYFIIKKIFDPLTGLMAYLFFTFCFWPYMYILQGAHQPLVLMNFLWAVLFLLYNRKNIFLNLVSGIFLGFMLFSSPTSPIYALYYLSAFIYNEFFSAAENFNLKKFLSRGGLVVSGAALISLIFLLPDGIESLQGYRNFLKFSQRGNNFVIYQQYLSQFFPVEDYFRGSGWGWIVKYFFLILPVMFSLYILSLIYLSRLSAQNPKLLLIILLSFIGIFAIEISGVAQLGRNYFPWLVGIIFLTSFSFYTYKQNFFDDAYRTRKKLFTIFISLSLLGHIAFNACVFLNDIFPSRLVTTFIHDWSLEHNIRELYNYTYHPRNKNIVWFLNNPKQKEQISLKAMETIKDVKEGFILIPPITGKTIYNECREGDFEGDPYLTELLITGEFQKFVVASFKSLASSRIWNQEEEICAYRDLILRQISDEDRQKGRAFILDAKKLQEEWFSVKYR